MLEQLFITTQILIIDVVMAADNAIIIGLIAANFAPDNRKKIIALGVGAAFVFRILAFIPFIVAISNFIGVQYMLNSSMKSIYVLIIVIASIVSIILMLTVVPIYGYIGSSYVLLFVESFVSVYMVAYVLLMYFRKGTF